MVKTGIGNVGTSKSRFQHNYIETIKSITPELYTDSEISIYGTENQVLYQLLGKLLKVANDLPNILPVSGEAPSSLRLKMLHQGPDTEIRPFEIEHKLLKPLGKGFKDFKTIDSFRNFVSGTLLPNIELNRISDTFIQGFSGQVSSVTTRKGVHDYFMSNLPWVYMLNTSAGGYPPANVTTINSLDAVTTPSSIVRDMLVSGSYLGKILTTKDGVQGLFEYIWRNREYPKVFSGIGPTFSPPKSYLPTDFNMSMSATGFGTSGVSSLTYASGTQLLDGLKTLLGIWYNKHDDGSTELKDAFDLYFGGSNPPEKIEAAGPFFKFLQAVSFGFYDVDSVVEELDSLVDIEKCPPEFLSYLGALIGWKFISGDVERWRAQLRKAVFLYKSKGTRQCLSDAMTLIFPGNTFNPVDSLVECWESYLPRLIYYMIATEAPHLQESRYNSTIGAALGVSNHSETDHDKNIRFHVDSILDRVNRKMISEGRKFIDVNNKSFELETWAENEPSFVGFKHRGAVVKVPPWEDERFYRTSVIDKYSLSSVSSILVSRGDSSGYQIPAAKVQEFTDYVTASALNSTLLGGTNKKFRFFTTGMNIAPNWAGVIASGHSLGMSLADSWNSKSSTAISETHLSSLGYAYSDLLYEKDNIMDGIAQIFTQFAPFHVQVRLVTKEEHTDYIDHPYDVGICYFLPMSPVDTDTSGPTANFVTSGVQVVGALSADTNYRRGKWTPAELFRGGERGCWYDFTDPATCKQADGYGQCIPDSDVSGEVYYIIDKSPNHNNSASAVKCILTDASAGEGQTALHLSGASHFDIGHIGGTAGAKAGLSSIIMSLNGSAMTDDAWSTTQYLIDGRTGVNYHTHSQSMHWIVKYIDDEQYITGLSSILQSPTPMDDAYPHTSATSPPTKPSASGVGPCNILSALNDTHVPTGTSACGRVTLMMDIKNTQLEVDTFRVGGRFTAASWLPAANIYHVITLDRLLTASEKISLREFLDNEAYRTVKRSNIPRLSARRRNYKYHLPLIPYSRDGRSMPIPRIQHSVSALQRNSAQLSSIINTDEFLPLGFNFSAGSFVGINSVYSGVYDASNDLAATTIPGRDGKTEVSSTFFGIAVSSTFPCRGIMEQASGCTPVITRDTLEGSREALTRAAVFNGGTVTENEVRGLPLPGVKEAYEEYKTYFNRKLWAKEYARDASGREFRMDNDPGDNFLAHAKGVLNYNSNFEAAGYLATGEREGHPLFPLKVGRTSDKPQGDVSSYPQVRALYADRQFLAFDGYTTVDGSSFTPENTHDWHYHRLGTSLDMARNLDAGGAEGERCFVTSMLASGVQFSTYGNTTSDAYRSALVYNYPGSKYNADDFYTGGSVTMLTRGAGAAHSPKYAPMIRWSFSKNENMWPNGHMRYSETFTTEDGVTANPYSYAHHKSYPDGNPVSSVVGIRTYGHEDSGAGYITNYTGDTARLSVSSSDPNNRYSERIVSMETSATFNTKHNGIYCAWINGYPVHQSNHPLRQFIPGETYQIEVDVKSDNPGKSNGPRLSLEAWHCDHPTLTDYTSNLYAICDNARDPQKVFGYEASAPYYEPSSGELVSLGWNPEASSTFTLRYDHQHPDGGGSVSVNASKNIVLTPGPDGDWRTNVIRFKYHSDRNLTDWGNGNQIKEADIGNIIYARFYAQGAYDKTVSGYSDVTGDETIITTQLKNFKLKRVTDPQCNQLLPNHDYSIKVRARGGKGDELIGIRVKTEPNGNLGRTEACEGTVNHRNSFDEKDEHWYSRMRKPYSNSYNFSSDVWDETYHTTYCRDFNQNKHDYNPAQGNDAVTPNNGRHADRLRWHRLPVSSFDLELTENSHGDMVPTGWYTKTFHFHTRNDKSDYNPNLRRTLFRGGKDLHCDESTYHVEVANLTHGNEEVDRFLTVDSVEIKDETYQETFKNYEKSDINSLFTFFDDLTTGNASRSATYSSGTHSVSGGSRDVYLENYGDTRYGQYDSSGIAQFKGISHPLSDD